MQYSKVDARFYFFNGKDAYTVEYTSGLGQWFIFKDREQSYCVHTKAEKLSPQKINFNSAEDVFLDYITSVSQ